MRAGVMRRDESGELFYTSMECKLLESDCGDFRRLAYYLRAMAKSSADGFASFTADNGVSHTVWVDPECVPEGMEVSISKGADPLTNWQDMP